MTTDPLDATCPLCGAEPGYLCFDPNPDRTPDRFDRLKPHKIRKTAPVSPKIEVKTRMVPEKYITLRDPGRKIHVYPDGFVSSYNTEIPANDVDIPLTKLWAFYEHGRDKVAGPAFIEFSSSQERAIEDIGWGTGATRGGVWATDSFITWLDNLDY